MSAIPEEIRKQLAAETANIKMDAVVEPEVEEVEEIEEVEEVDDALEG